MDSDDRMRPEKLFHLKKILLEKGPGYIACGLVEYFAADGLGEGYRRYAGWLNGLAKTGRQWQEIYKECSVPSPCWMAWRSDLEACEAFQHDTYPEDYDLCFRWKEAGMQVLAADQILHEWRDWSARTSRTNEHYLDNAFLELKTSWFLRLDHDPARPLVLWGAGKKGKRLAMLLADAKIDFRWVCDNPKKWGKHIHGTLLEQVSVMEKLNQPQIIVAVAAPDGQQEIFDFFGKQGMEQCKDYFFFC